MIRRPWEPWVLPYAVAPSLAGTSCAANRIDGNRLWNGLLDCVALGSQAFASIGDQAKKRLRDEADELERHFGVHVKSEVLAGPVGADLAGSRSRYGLPPRQGIVEPYPDVEVLLARDLEARLGDVGGEGALIFRPFHGLGRVGDHLLDLADKERVELIVVGTHHQRGVARLASVAGVTLHYSNASVAVAPLPEGALLVPDQVSRIRRVLVPTDLSRFSSYAVPLAYTLLGDMGGEVFLLHVVPEPAAAPNGELAAQLRAFVPKHGVPENVTTRTEIVHHSDVARAIEEAAERAGADAICMGSHGRGGLKRTVMGSVTEAVMRHGPRPVFVIRPLPA